MSMCHYVHCQADAILQLGEEIGTKLAKAEACGAEGNIDDSMKLMAEVEELNKNKAEAEVSVTRYLAIAELVGQVGFILPEIHGQ